MPPATNLRASYTPWLASSPQKKMWIYQACDSDGCNSVGNATQSGWPTHMIDAPATQNRAMEWQAWRQKAGGELYYDTTYAFARGDAWTSQYYYGGNGDGTLFYPGTPAKIGGSTDVPIASLRLKLIREGMEDYEYFKALADAGDPAMADSEAAALSPAAYQNETDPAKIDAARHRIALRIEQLTGQTPPPMSGASASSGGQNGSPPAGSDGSGSGGNAATGDTGAAPAPTATTGSGHSRLLGGAGAARRPRAVVARAGGGDRPPGGAAAAAGDRRAPLPSLSGAGPFVVVDVHVCRDEGVSRSPRAHPRPPRRGDRHHPP